MISVPLKLTSVFCIQSHGLAEVNCSKQVCNGRVWFGRPMAAMTIAYGMSCCSACGIGFRPSSTARESVYRSPKDWETSHLVGEFIRVMVGPSTLSNLIRLRWEQDCHWLLSKCFKIATNVVKEASALVGRLCCTCIHLFGEWLHVTNYIIAAQLYK